MQQEIILAREVEAVQIPSGDGITLPQGTPVMITQTLGGTYTVATQAGLARISSKDIDALGIDPEEQKKKVAAKVSKTAKKAPAKAKSAVTKKGK
mgnify:CR=1 FL=1